jgi:hypothetical protein
MPRSAQDLVVVPGSQVSHRVIGGVEYQMLVTIDEARNEGGISEVDTVDAVGVLPTGLLDALDSPTLDEDRWSVHEGAGDSVEQSRCPYPQH